MITGYNLAIILMIVGVSLLAVAIFRATRPIKPVVTGNTSDGYHTFDELYEHRHVLFINVVLSYKTNVFKTWKNNEGERWAGWFILGINTAQGQITYHIPERFWSQVDVEEIEYNADYDGHSSADVLERLSILGGV